MKRSRAMAFAIGGLLVASCKREQTTVKRDLPATSTGASIAAEVGPPPSKRALEGYPPPVDSDALGCTLTGDWTFTQPRDLRFRPEAPPFAHLGGAKTATVTFLEGPKPFAYAELAWPSMRAFGFVTGDVSLHASKAYVFAGYLVAGTQARFVVRGAAPTEIGVELDVGDCLHPSKPPRDERTCDELALDEVTFDARAAIADPTEKTVVLDGTSRIAVRATSGGAVVGEIDPSKCGGLHADVIGHAGADARVVMFPESLDPTLDYRIVGWIPASKILPTSGGSGGSWGTGGPGGAARARVKRKRASCPHEVPMVAEQSGERRLVGAIAAKASFYLMDSVPEGWIGVIPIFDFTADDKTTLLVKEDVLTDCTIE
jgi:hypothetical protein